ncbi:Asp23/Gls24 family envelope stress response protein [Galbitalea soli]|uniref:Asp23/Gls24 family envelope stress response protein n=1 Tax=Galbitalea soli TaxID=1268042 RepID=A0A7C9TQP8_9MICO|nr:Asp23/Gls24 family envelope stress response protein [Galbitalea soli]NEM91617.1 Asp23/Gls24 family envelope stress response protein [Galbitalea soli]NYJ30311.1 putative alkaline shock family protein YloU [Galbitalea soli]
MTERSADIGGSGYTLDELSDYLDRGMSPAIPAIDDNAECQAMLATLSRVAGLSRELVSRDAAENPTIDEGWLAGLLSAVGREVRAGRDIPFSSSDPTTRLTITEGAVRELVRAAGDSVDGVLVGTVAIDGDVTQPGAEVAVAVTISIVPRRSARELAEAVRERVRSELLKHTELAVGAIDVTVADVHLLPSDEPAPGAVTGDGTTTGPAPRDEEEQR